MTEPTIVYERPNQEETLEEVTALAKAYDDLRTMADEARLALHTKVREANRIHGIKQEDVGRAMVTTDSPDGVTKSRVYAIITSLDEREQEAAS